MPIPVVPVPFVVPPASAPFPLQIGDPLGLAALEAAPQGPLLLLWVRDPEASLAMDALAQVGVLVDIQHAQDIPGGRLVHAVPTDRVRVTGMQVDDTRLTADVTSWPVPVSDEREAELKALFVRYVQADPNMPDALAHSDTPALFDLFQVAFPMEGPERQEALELEADDLLVRIELTLANRIEALAGRAMETIVPAPEDDPGPYPEEDREAVLYELELRTRTGLLDAEELLGELEELAIDLAEPLAEDLEPLVQASLERQRTRQAAWTRPTQAEQLLAALNDLEGALLLPGVARGGWIEEIDDDIEAALEEADQAPEGIVLWTMQGAMYAASGRGLEIGFRTLPDNQPADRERFGGRVRDTLEAAGLPIRWSGHPDDPIHVDIPWHLPVD